MSATQLTQLLSAMYADMSVRPEYLAHLAIGGLDGTLANRFGTLAVARTVRAKTGTLNDTIALSGYVLGPAPERAVAFSFLANGVSGKHHAARTLADQIASSIAHYLWAR
jgi:D-alanyl-D-alanine carboxypeptidase/D-alanyl-D-alanine-endopeptidase (penicillin-binding protein 4)